MQNYKVSHIAFWVKDLETTKSFYEKYFNAKSGELYHNQNTGFKSYFLTLSDFCKIEIMNKKEIANKNELAFGYAHIAISVETKENVDNLTQILEKAGYQTTKPRTTGDGCYESTVLDPDGNIIEITI